MQTVIYVMTSSQSHDHFPLFSIFWAPMTPPFSFYMYVCVRVCVCTLHFLKVLYEFVSFIPKEHTDVGVAVKWPNKLSEKIPSESNHSLSVPTTKPHPV